MPLDPQIAPIVDVVETAAAERGDTPSTLQERRDGYLGLAAIAGAGPDLDEIVDQAVPGLAGAPEIPVRIYRNAGAQGIFIYIHGGGYTIGDLDTHDQVCRQLALESESTVVSVDYRLAPEDPFPAGVDDCWAAFLWADENRAELGGSADARIVVGGDSAGGNLSAVIALMARDAGTELAAQLLVYPAVDVDDDSPSMTDNASGYVLTAETMQFFSECYAADPADWRASPIKAASHDGVAPAVIITAEFDPLRDQGMRYADTLLSAGVEVEHTVYDGMVHIFFQLGPIVEAAARSVTQIAEAAKAALRDAE